MKFSEYAKTSNYLKAVDLPKNGTIQHTVVDVQEVEMRDGKLKPVLYCDDQTAIVVNKTNAGWLADNGYDDHESLIGVTLTIVRQKTSYKGQDGVRFVQATKQDEMDA